MIDYIDAALFNNDSLDKQIHIAISGTQNTLGNDDIVSESFQLVESLCSEEYLKFGAVEPRCVKFTVKYSAPKLLNKWLTITMTLKGSQTPFEFGDYQVLSDKPSSDRTTRDITAYSHFHKILKNKYKSWYKSAWGTSGSMTIKEFRDSFFARLHETHSWIVQEQTTLINDDVVIRRAKKIPRISGKDILSAICELNGVFGYIDRDSVFRYKVLSDLEPATDIGSSFTITTEYEDYTTTAIDRVEILSENGDLLASAGNSESGSQNKYVIENNFMLKALGSGDAAKDTLQFVASHLLNVIGYVTYTPFDAEFKGNPCFEVGDRISFQAHGTTVFSYILQRKMKGIQSLRDNFTAESGDAVYPEDNNTLSSKMQKIKDYASEKSEVTIDSYDPVTVDAIGQEGDLYFQSGQTVTKHPRYPISFPTLPDKGYVGEYLTPPSPTAGSFDPVSISWDDQNGYYSLLCEGTAQWVQQDVASIWPRVYGTPYVYVGITEPGKYHWHCKVTHTLGGFAAGDGEMGFVIGYASNTGYLPDVSGLAPDTVFYDGTRFNIGAPGVENEYDGTVNIGQGMLTEGKLYLYFSRNRLFPEGMDTTKIGSGTMSFTELYFEKIDPDTQQGDRGYTQTTETYIGSMYAMQEDPSTGNLDWQEVKRVSDVDTSESSGGEVNNGLAITSDGKRNIKLKSNVMRAWVKADPPQIDRTFNQFCVRYTGTPDSNITISAYNGVEWENRYLKQADDGSFAIKCGGTKTSGTVSYYAYKIDGFDVGTRYYFNFAADFGANATFNYNNNKSLGVVFNTTGTISSDDYSGEPHEFDESTLYESFYRNDRKHYYDFDFVATAYTMYMCVVLGDLQPCTTQLSITEFVLSKDERKYIRKIYLYDVASQGWLEYRPFGAGDDGGTTPIEYLAELKDVSLNNLQNNQVIKYNAATEKFENANESGGGGGDGSTITYGINVPQSIASDGDLYYLLDDFEKQKGLYLYMQSAWKLIQGTDNLVVRYEYINSFVNEKNYTLHFTAKKAGLYFIYINAAAMGGSSSIQCSGTQRFYNTYSADSNRFTKVGMYYLDIGDTVDLAMSYTNVGYENYYISSALICLVKDTDCSVTLDGNAGNTTGNVTISSNETGEKFIFAVATAPSTNNTTVDIKSNNASAGLPSTTLQGGDKKMLYQILQTVVDGSGITSVGVAINNGGSYATSNAFIFTLSSLS